MSVDTTTVRRVARLARIAVSDEDVVAMQGELNAILGFVEQLGEVDVTGIEPMTSVIPMHWGTFPPLDADPTMFVEAMEGDGRKIRLPEIGVAFDV